MVKHFCIVVIGREANPELRPGWVRYFAEIVGVKNFGAKISAMRLFGPKKANFGQKWAKKGQKWPKMAKIKGFLTLFRQKHRKSAPEAFFLLSAQARV